MPKRGCGPGGCTNKLTFDKQRMPNPLDVTILLTEPFGLNGVDNTQGGAPFYNAPTGWTASGDYFFYGNNDILPFCNVTDSSGTIYMALANGTPIPSSKITTKAVSTIGMTNIKLSFNECRGITAVISPSLILEYSINNGSTWSTITWTETSLALTWVATGDINLPSNAENVSQLKIRFSIIDDGSGEQVSIDDVKIKGYS